MVVFLFASLISMVTKMSKKVQNLIIFNDFNATYFSNGHKNVQVGSGS